MLDETSKKPLGVALLDAADVWRERLRAELALRGDTGHGAGIDLLVQLDPSGMTQTALTERMGLSKQAVQQVLDRLEAAGHVRREPDARDRRVKHVVPTDTGLRLVAERVALEQALETEFRDKLGKKRFTQLRKSLRKLSAPV